MVLRLGCMTTWPRSTIIPGTVHKVLGGGEAPVNVQFAYVPGGWVDKVLVSENMR